MRFQNEENTHHRLLKNTLIAAILSASPIAANAALPANATLNFYTGQLACIENLGTPPDACSYGTYPVSGSYFALDTNNDGIFADNEKIAMSPDEGVRLGDIQTAPSIDLPWSFLRAPGMHQTTLPVVIANGDDGTGDSTASLDFSGWGVSWNGNNIPLGGDSFQSDTGIATVTCTASCENGESFSLAYTAHVPTNDPSQFGTVFYMVHLEGMIGTGGPIPPTKSVVVNMTGGNLQECSSVGGNNIHVAADITTTDINDIATVSWFLDGNSAGSGNELDIFTSLGVHSISVVVDTVASGSFESAQTVTVRDITPPELAIRFIDQSTGLEVTEVAGSGSTSVTTVYDVSDVCDAAVTATGTAVPVHAMNDGDTIKVDTKRSTTTTNLNTTAVNVSANAKDASGNQQHREAILLIAN